MSGSCDGEKIIFKDQVHAVADARLHVPRKTKAPDEWTHRSRHYDPYGPGNAASEEFIDY
jgi:hypothetical protein